MFKKKTINPKKFVTHRVKVNRLTIKKKLLVISYQPTTVFIFASSFIHSYYKYVYVTSYIFISVYFTNLFSRSQIRRINAIILEKTLRNLLNFLAQIRLIEVI